MKRIVILTIIISILSLGVLFGTIVFFVASNDHTECDTITETSFDANGNKVETKTHICKEKYNL